MSKVNITQTYGCFGPNGEESGCSTRGATVYIANAESRRPSQEIPRLTIHNFAPVSAVEDKPTKLSVCQILPEIVLRITFEAIADPGDEICISPTDQDRLGIAYSLCLVNKRVRGWIEPLLYRSVFLASFQKLQSFAYAVKSKDPEFLCNVQALWIPFKQRILESECIHSFDFEGLFSGLGNLKKLGLTSDWLGILFKVTSSTSIRDLTLIRPDDSFGKICPYLSHLSLRSLHFIDPHLESLRSLTVNASIYDNAQKCLTMIPHICVEFTNSPGQHPSLYMRALATLLSGLKYGQARRAASSPPANGIHNIISTAEKRSLLIKFCPLIIDGSIVNDNTRIKQLKTSWSQAISVYEARGPVDRPVELDGVYISEEQVQWYKELSERAVLKTNTSKDSARRKRNWDEMN